MTEPTKAELAGKLEERVRVLETTVASATGAINFAKWFLSILLAALFVITAGGIGQLLLTMGDLRATVSSLAERIAESKTQHATDLARLEKSMEALEKRLQPKYAGTRLHQGEVVRISGNKLVIRLEEPGAREQEYTLTPNTQIMVNGKRVPRTIYGQGCEWR